MNKIKNFLLRSHFCLLKLASCEQPFAEIGLKLLEIVHFFLCVCSTDNTEVRFPPKHERPSFMEFIRTKINIREFYCVPCNFEKIVFTGNLFYLLFAFFLLKQLHHSGRSKRFVYKKLRKHSLFLNENFC